MAMIDQEKSLKNLKYHRFIVFLLANIIPLHHLPLLTKNSYPHCKMHHLLNLFSKAYIENHLLAYGFKFFWFEIVVFQIFQWRFIFP